MENKELKENYIDERTGIEYKLVGDYYVLDLVLPKPRRNMNIYCSRKTIKKRKQRKRIRFWNIRFIFFIYN